MFTSLIKNYVSKKIINNVNCLNIQLPRKQLHYLLLDLECVV